ncbi:MAG: hypothetical protein OJJ21_24035 [Ferrovibrio sp.]|uniref:hypothetical protein n=1 Tax=Ferrovibrio sp. TaxID=1917215 RepID=UPI0026246E6F|nr:hypothetical protein [Ferrovibrio sp.]MCW0236688.1 hypothetical protein [Ferrovibrio sp.]
MRATDDLLVWGLLIGGIFFGFSVAMTLFTPDANLSNWIDFAGSALGAMATVIAAFAVMHIQIRRQISADTQKVEIEAHREANRLASELQRREQELSAARAVFVSDLSRLMEYLRASSRVIVAMTKSLAADGKKGALVMPAYPLDALLRCERLVTLANTPSAELVAEVMTLLQLQAARVSSEVERYNGDDLGGWRGQQRLDHLESGLMSTIELYVKSANLFEYARREVREALPIALTEENFGNALSNLGLMLVFDMQDLVKSVKDKMLPKKLQSSDDEVKHATA